MEGKLFLGQYMIWVILLLGQLDGYRSCIEKEKMALLDLKKFHIPSSESRSVFNTWTNNTKSDCCQWKGVKCDRTSGRVIMLSIGWTFYGESSFNLSLLHPFEEVQVLDLYGSGFSGLFDDVKGYTSLGRLRNLEILDLSFNGFNNSIFPFLNAATALKTLLLGGNNMDGPFHIKELKDLTNLEILDLSENRFNCSIPVQELPALRKLKALDLRGNEFSASRELKGICELKNVQELDLSQNKLVGQFPLCLTSLTGLRVLDLSSNQLTGKLPSYVRNFEFLEYLSLFNNSFKGLFSLGLLANLSELKVFKLSSQSNSLKVEFESYWKPKFQLKAIALQHCNLEEVPHFLQYHKDLRLVDLSDNKITGIFPSWLLANNTKLKYLLLQNNCFTNFQLPKSAHKLLYMDVSSNEFRHLFPDNIGWILPHLQYMNISKNYFEGNLPSSLSNVRSIEYMDLSHNSFHGKLPRRFLKGCHSLVILKLSHNKLSGEVFPEPTNFTNLTALFMDNNQFTGKIGQGWQSSGSLYMLDISNNKLTGVIPSWIAELPFLFALLLSNNSLQGEIPISLFSISGLRLLDLSANILSGNIPPQVNSGQTSVVLLLQDNNLSGVIPNTLPLYVSLLDLRNNKLSGNIPEFISTQRISILLMRGNNLTGHIPSQLCALSNIRLLDLANNKLSGSIPSCLSNISFRLGEEYTPYYDFGIVSNELSARSYMGRDSTSTGDVSVYFRSLLRLDQFTTEYDVGTQTKIEFATKHRFDAYVGGNLGYLFGMDLSENELSGEIPVELGGLMEFHALNLSHNSLSGAIPESFSGMKNMESLDLSYNRLQGRIPPQLAKLSSLAVFDVSFNNLSGVIPQGQQFNTFDTRSYLGNPLLCGKPTNNSCESNKIQEPYDEVEDDESTIDMVSFYWSMVAAYVTILLGILVFLSIDSHWSRAWFYVIDAFIHRVLW